MTSGCKLFPEFLDTIKKVVNVQKCTEQNRTEFVLREVKTTAALKLHQKEEKPQQRIRDHVDMRAAGIAVVL